MPDTNFTWDPIGNIYVSWKNLFWIYTNNADFNFIQWQWKPWTLQHNSTQNKTMKKFVPEKGVNSFDVCHFCWFCQFNKWITSQKMKWKKNTRENYYKFRFYVMKCEEKKKSHIINTFDKIRYYSFLWSEKSKQYLIKIHWIRFKLCIYVVRSALWDSLLKQAHQRQPALFSFSDCFVNITETIYHKCWKLTSARLSFCWLTMSTKQPWFHSVRFCSLLSFFFNVLFFHCYSIVLNNNFRNLISHPMHCRLFFGCN